MQPLITGILCLVAFLMPGKAYETTKGNQRSAHILGVTAFSLQEYEESNTHGQGAKDDSPQWYAALKRPEWWLVVAAFFTLGAIWKQAREMRKATQAMRESTEAVQRQIGIMERQTKAAEDAAIAARANAEAAKKSTVLQEAAMQQWLIFRNWRVKHRPSVVDVELEIVNPSNLPLTMLTTKMRAKEKESWRAHYILLPPDVPCTVDFPDIRLDGEEENGYLNGGTVIFVLFGLATYRDSFGEVKTQDFSGRLLFNKRGADFVMEWFPDNPLAAHEKQDTRKGEDPN